MQKYKNLYMAGIVTYNPDISKLRDAIESVLKQSMMEEILIVDNNSENIVEIEKFVDNKKVFIVENNANMGIAQALNSIMQRACDKGYEWVLTCDQDSIMPSNLLKVFVNYIQEEDVGIISPKVFDTNAQSFVSEKSPHAISEVEKCITSGSFNRVSAWKQVGGFDEFMFIDGVDFDYCFRLRGAGYKIIQLNEVSIVHEIGNISIKKFCCTNVAVMNHNAFRKYYIVRNRIYTDFKHHKKLKFKSLLSVIKAFLWVLLFEADKKEKIEAIRNGFIDGIKYGKTLI